MAITKEDENQGILVSLQPSKDIWMVFMAVVKDFHVKMRLAPFCYSVSLIKYSILPRELLFT